MTSYLSSLSSSPEKRHLTHQKAILCPPQTVFNAISDVSKYSSFLRFMTSSHATSVKSTNGDPTAARLKVEYPTLYIEEDWRVEVKCSRVTGTIELEYLDNSSSATLETWTLKWKILPPPGTAKGKTATKCLLKMELELKFRYTVVDQVFAQLQERFTEKFFEKFQGRIVEVAGAEKAEAEKAEAERARAQQQQRTREAKLKAEEDEQEKVKKKAPKKLEVRSGMKAGSG